MTTKKDELNEMDIKKENADLSMNDLSDVSGGKLYVEPGADTEDDRLLNPKGSDAVLQQPKGSDDALLNPKGADKTFFEGKKDGALS